MPAQVRAYDLGRIMLQTPGPKGPMPIRLRGAIGAPATAGRHPIVVVLHGRNFFNRKLAQLGADDAPTGSPRCRRPRRLTARAQQRWLDLAAEDFFEATLRGARRPVWLRLGALRPSRVYGRRVLLRRAG